MCTFSVSPRVQGCCSYCAYSNMAGSGYRRLLLACTAAALAAFLAAAPAKQAVSFVWRALSAGENFDWASEVR